MNAKKNCTIKLQYFQLVLRTI